MRKISLLLVVVMLASMIAIPSFAGGSSQIKESASGFYYVEANGAQPRLSAASQDKFIQVDGLYFKDMNGNGSLDVYEDWRVDTVARVNDLIAQMTLQERVGALGFGGICGSNGVVVTEVNDDSILYNEDFYYDTGVGPVTGFGGRNKSSMRIQVQDMGVITFIAAMTGLPKDSLEFLNKLQTIGEGGRLGIPLVFSGDRSYNTWGGMIDMAHYAFAVAHDEELLYDLVSQYAKESVAIGYQQVFHGYGDEIGSWYGDEVNNIAKMAVIETKAYDDNNFSSHSKHFIGRGGRNSYVASISPANLLDSWLVGWKAIVDAGTRWVMTNNNIGITPGLQVYMDKATLDILRVDLGYTGIVVLDWPLDAGMLMERGGVTRDGVDVSTLTLAERYALILNSGVDMFSCYVAIPGTDLDLYDGLGFQRYLPDAVIEAINAGILTEERVNLSVNRIMTNRLDSGLFENPYRDWDEAAELFASDAYKAEQFEINSNEDINRARRASTTAMEERLMVESTVLFKNDNGILPLANGTKMFITSNNDVIKEADIAALGVYGEVVDSMNSADVVVLHVTALDDAYEDMMDDVKDAGKPVILIFEGTFSVSDEPGTFEAENCDAVLWQTYRNVPDHGTTTGSYYRYVQPDVTADMVFGVRKPSGKTVFEIGRSNDDYVLSWYDLAYDIGADSYTRLYMAALVKQDPTTLLPNNVGDVLYPSGFGMEYGKTANIRFDTLVVPAEISEYEVLNPRSGNMDTVRDAVNATQKAGEAFEIMFIAFNDGGDGYTTAEVYDGSELIASKFVGVNGGDFIIVRMDITLGAGEHVISVGGLSTTIVVE